MLAVFVACEPGGTWELRDLAENEVIKAVEKRTATTGTKGRQLRIESRHTPNKGATSATTRPLRARGKIIWPKAMPILSFLILMCARGLHSARFRLSEVLREADQTHSVATFSETGSLQTAPSTGESANPRSPLETIATMIPLHRQPLPYQGPYSSSQRT